ncbi:hypothetical protein [Helicobacter pylori]|uniref:hypothetical protein n=1 Tax=Helicobacter pylori TaxID=210 RepID=UPI00040BCDC4|nr:hypothetical protein [Helicobacter pylori]
MKKDREKKQKYSNFTDATIMGSTSEESALHARANREHFSSLDKLEEISKRKVNPKYIKQNINQQAGYSAEIKEQARVNANNILAGKPERIVQYDDLSSGQKAQVKVLCPNHATPKKNHEIVDYASVDKKRNVIPGTLTQSKFVGRNGEECFKKLLSKDYEKYFENGAKVKIARDQYGDFQKALNTRIKSLESQIAKQKEFGNFQKAAHLEEKLQHCKTIKSHTRPASVTKEEAIESRLNPKLSVGKDVASISHQAGMNAAQTGALISGGVSVITNIYECLAKGKDPKEALKHTAIATTKDVVRSYGSAFIGSSFGDMVQSGTNQVIQSFGKDSLQAMILDNGAKSVKIFDSYLSKEIDEAELIEQLYHAGKNLLSGILVKFGNKVASISSSIPGIGPLISVLSPMASQFLHTFLKVREEAKMARQRRIEVEKECREIIKLLEAYQNQFKEVFEPYFHETTKFFNQSFDELERAFYAGDADWAIGVNNKIQERLGQKPLFSNKQECWELIISNKEIRM